MANKKNLKPQAHILTVEEASKGGKNSVKKRLEKKELRELAKAVLSLETIVTIDGQSYVTTHGAALVLSLLKKATNPKDSQCVNAAKTLISLVGADRIEEERDLIRAQIQLTEAKTAALNNGEDESTVTNTLDLILAEMREQAENEI